MIGHDKNRVNKNHKYLFNGQTEALPGRGLFVYLFNQTFVLLWHFCSNLWHIQLYIEFLYSVRCHYLQKLNIILTYSSFLKNKIQELIA